MNLIAKLKSHFHKGYRTGDKVIFYEYDLPITSKNRFKVLKKPIYCTIVTINGDIEDNLIVLRYQDGYETKVSTDSPCLRKANPLEILCNELSSFLKKR